MRLRTADRRNRVAVVGGGLAGSEAAWQISARLGDNVLVDLFEMRPARTTEAHKTSDLAELVCSNSLKSDSEATPTGLLKRDLLLLDSLILKTALECRVPAGKALAVDREMLGKKVTTVIKAQKNINLIREEVIEIPNGYDKVIVATGPLTSERLASSIAELIGERNLFFYDAIAPIIDTDSIDMNIAFTQDRYGEPGEGDYLNLPMNKEEYYDFVDALLTAKTVPYHNFESVAFFEGCLPIEEIASRGKDSLSFGPLKPVGLTNPATGKRPYAVVQLRRENKTGDAVNLVGFQTKLTYPEQERVLRSKIPALQKAVFLRHGSLHRNTYIDGPKAVNNDLTLHVAPNVRLAGQMTGVEGYVESIAIGALAGLFTVSDIADENFSAPPATSTLGALLRYITQEREGKYQPTNINFSLFPPLEEKVRGRKERRSKTLERARENFDEWRTRAVPKT